MNHKYLIGLMAMCFSATVLAAAPSFEDVDANADGVVSSEEAAAVEELDFTAADTDGNGEISPEEFAAAMKKE
ncbi:MAG: hypothetical protein WBD34_17485 [Burkholderiaceae bacterium]